LIIDKKHKNEMSLNKFTNTSTGFDLDLDIGCDELKANNITTTNIDLVTINGQPYPPNTVPVKKAVGLEYQTAYTFNVYSDMVNVWSGSPDVPAGSLPIGDTIELTTQFNLDPSLIGGQGSFAGNFRISFDGVVLGEADNLILSSPQSRTGELKLSITRVDTVLIQVNLLGYYNNTSLARQSITPTVGPLSYPYDENVSNTIQIEWRPSVGSPTEYMTCNLQNTKIIQY
jgi:hypothetical protein